MDEFEMFLVQAWLIWNQRNTVIHGRKLKVPCWLNKKVLHYLGEFQQTQEQLSTPVRQSSVNVWHPPPASIFKLDFNPAIFADLNSSGFGVIIRNERDEVMAAMSVKGPPVNDGEEAKILACWKALEFSIDAGFLELIIEGDNANVMRSISSPNTDHFLLEHVFKDVHCLIHGLHWMSVSYIKQDANRVAHSLTRYARNVHDEIHWMEDSPPLVVEAIYYDSIIFQ
nr:uncharacterized protein LOC112019374 [Quercus suber]